MLRITVQRTALMALLLLLAGYWWLRHEPPARSTGSNVVRVSEVTPHALKSLSARATPLNSPSPPVVHDERTSWLPAADMPALAVLNTLKSQADRGDPRAACRIAITLDRCRQWQTASNDSAADAAHCQNIQPAMTAWAGRYLLQAARSGHRGAMHYYLLTPPFSEALSQIDSDDWRDYQSHAPGLLQDAIAYGDTDALLLGWYLASGGAGPGGVSLVPQDAAIAVSYATALLPLLNEDTRASVQHSVAPLLQQLTPEQALRAQREGERIRSSYFNSSREGAGQAGLHLPAEPFDPAICE